MPAPDRYQIELLTGMLYYISKDGNPLPNPFYQKPLDFIKKHYDKAKEIYPVLVQQYKSAWFETGCDPNAVIPGIEELTLFGAK